MAFNPEKQTVLRVLGTDALSHIVVAARVGLWGALPESLSVLRGGIESCGQLGYVVVRKRYKTFIYEANQRGRFRQVGFESACEQLDTLGQRLLRLHQQISDAAAHSTVKRMSLLEYKFEGKEYDRLGFAFEPRHAGIALFHCLELAWFLPAFLQLAYEHDHSTFRWADDVSIVKQFIESLPSPEEEMNPNGEATA